MKFRNWKTTLAGVLGGIATAVLPIVQSGQTDHRSIITGVVLGILGWLAGDHDNDAAAV